MFLETLQNLLLAVVLLAAAIAFAYVIVRVASFAHFRTKLEYWRSYMKEFNGGKDNGKE